MIHKTLGLKVFREGFAPSMTEKELTVLRDACRRNDPELLQGRTTQPPPLMCVSEWKCEGGCAIGYAGWKGDIRETVGEVEQYFARLCFEANSRFSEHAAARNFLNWFDDTPRIEALKLLADEIDAILTSREIDEPIIR